jgi:hypothetical protein
MEMAGECSGGTASSLEHAIYFLIKLHGAHLHAFSFGALGLVQHHARTLSFSVRDSHCAAFCWILPLLERANRHTLMTMKVCVLIFREKQSKKYHHVQALFHSAKIT